MKFNSGNPLQTSRRIGSRDRSVDEQEDLEAQLRAAQNQATNQGVNTDLLFNPANPYRGPIDGAPPGSARPPPAPNTRAGDRLDPTQDVDESHLENAARQRALELMSQGTIDLDAVRNNIRDRSQNAIGEAVGGSNARAAAMGFLDSGVAQGMEGTLRREGAIAEEAAVLQAEEAARSENLRNIIAGAGISQGERGLAADMDDRALRNQLIMDILNGGDGEVAEDPADLNGDGYVNAGEGLFGLELGTREWLGTDDWGGTTREERAEQARESTNLWDMVMRQFGAE